MAGPLLQRVSSLPERPPAPATVEGLRQTLRIPGRLYEIAGEASSGKSTLALDLCLATIREGGVAAWIDPTGTFFPLAALEELGTLDRLFVVKVPDGAQALRAADMLLSSPGAVKLLVVDLPPRLRTSDAQLFRLQRLAEKSVTSVVLLHERPMNASSLGPSVAVRVRTARAAKEWALRLEVTHQKAGPRGPIQDELFHSPERLRPDRTL
jgi:hypothetical protein